MEQKINIINIFPCPVYIVKRDSNLTFDEEKEIEDIIKEGTRKVGDQDFYTDNFYIFDTKLKNLKEFCEEQIKIYVKEILNPKRELDFYITQSWINVVEPGGNIKYHYHANSIISGAFYVSTEEDDKIMFREPNSQIKETLKIEPEEYNVWNSNNWSFPVNNNVLIIFPSWLGHEVQPNEKATINRISFSFNVFARGSLGEERQLNELIL